jgi:hypothetical protein
VLVTVVIAVATVVMAVTVAVAVAPGPASAPLSPAAATAGSRHHLGFCRRRRCILFLLAALAQERTHTVCRRNTARRRSLKLGH